MHDPRGPWDVPDDPGIDVTRGFDTDGDGVPDTAVLDDGFDLVVATDLDADGFADQIITVDGHAHVHDVLPAIGGVGADPPD